MGKWGDFHICSQIRSVSLTRWGGHDAATFLYSEDLFGNIQWLLEVLKHDKIGKKCRYPVHMPSCQRRPQLHTVQCEKAPKSNMPASGNLCLEPVSRSNRAVRTREEVHGLLYISIITFIWFSQSTYWRDIFRICNSERSFISKCLYCGDRTDLNSLIKNNPVWRK
ncbi:hypothetical protein GJAV_G00037260 [Gymnothorax javanicus]|nr:hypothetical protein GJAV_G00037260 [Gymnothorax javanicus]